MENQKQVVNGRALPTKVWHIPSLNDELFYEEQIYLYKRKIGVEEGKEVAPKIGEISRKEVVFIDKNNHFQEIARGFVFVNKNNKRNFVITTWEIPTNAEHIIDISVSIYSSSPEKARAYYDKMVAKWDIPNPNFEKDVVETSLQIEKIYQDYLEHAREIVSPIIERWEEFDDEHKFENAIIQALTIQGFKWNQFDGFTDPIFHGVFDDHFDKNIEERQEKIKEKRRKKEHSNGVSTQYWGRYGSSFEDDGSDD